MVPLTVLALGLLAVPGVILAADFRLTFPVDCRLGQDCIIQNYVDVDDGPGWRDYQCGTLTYDGHKGTDIRVRDLQALARGVSVYAAAAGTVRGVRNDMDDRRPGESHAAYFETITGRECGNGVVIVHEGGFETQYCHLKKGSVAVAPGAAVAAGEFIGTVGLSGKTQFPHLHLSVRRGGSVVGPFSGPCSSSHGGLWLDRIEYTGTRLFKSGFSDMVQTLDSIEEGNDPQLTADAPILLFWVNVVDIRKGDLQEIRIAGPDGTVLAEHRLSIEQAKVNWLGYAGRKRPPGGWPSGRYTAFYRLQRNSEPIIEERFVIEVH